MTTFNLKKIGGFVSLLFIAQLSIAQQPICTWGEPLTKEVPASKINKILTADANGIYVQSEHGPITNQHIVLEKYDASYKKVFAKDITPYAGSFNDALYYRTLLTGKGKFYVIAQHWKKETKTATLNAREVSLEGIVSSNIIDLDKEPTEKALKMIDYQYAVSDDKSKILVLALPDFAKGAAEKIRLKAFDSDNMKELWSKEVEFPVGPAKGSKFKIAIDNNGDAYVYRDAKLDKGIFTRSLNCFTALTMKWEEKTTNIGANYVPNIEMKFNAKGDLVLSGFYTSKNNVEMEGTFFFRIDAKTKALAAEKVEPLGKDLLLNFMSDGMAAKPNASLDNFEFIDLLGRSDGSMILLAEHTLMDKTAVPGTGGAGVFPTYDYVYRTGDVMIVCIGADGHRLWSTSFKKTQGEKTRREYRCYDSFVYGIFKDQLVILWNNIDLNYMMIPEYKENDGVVHKKEKEFGKNPMFATFMEVIGSDGTHKYQNLKFGLPLTDLHKGSMFEMSMNTNLFQIMPDGILLYSELNADASRYKFGKIKL